MNQSASHWWFGHIQFNVCVNSDPMIGIDVRTGLIEFELTGLEKVIQIGATPEMIVIIFGACLAFIID